MVISRANYFQKTGGRPKLEVPKRTKCPNRDMQKTSKITK